MGALLTVVGITLGVAVWQLAGETAAEYVAKYVVDQDDLGASTQDPTLEPGARSNGADLAISASASGEIAPVLLANTASRVSDSTVAAPQHAVPAQLETVEVAAVEPAATAPMTVQDQTVSGAQTGDDPLLSLIGDTPYRRSDGTVFMPIAAQRVFGFRTVIGERLTVPQTVELPGRVKTNPSTAHMIQSAQDGFVEAPVGGYPFEGQRVTRGQILGYLKPALSTLEEADYATRVQELVNEIDLTRKRMARLEEVLMVRYRASRIEQMRIEIDGLRRRLSILRDTVERPIELRAQTDGIISVINASPGQFLHAGHTIFEIVDPSRLWVTASAFDPEIRDRLIDASAVSVDGRKIALKFVGGGLALESQALPMQFEVLDGPDDLNVGLPVTVVIRLQGPSISGLRVPRASVTRTSDGRSLVWERRSAESFVAHHVSPQPIDSESVLITSGFGTSARIVTKGVATLGQVQ
jgi:hypothetical protein